MAEVIVSIENGWAIDGVIDAIKKLRGVTSAKLWNKDESVPPSTVATKKYSPRIEKLRQLCGTRFSQEEVNSDSRLAYLLNK